MQSFKPHLHVTSAIEFFFPTLLSYSWKCKIRDAGRKRERKRNV